MKAHAVRWPAPHVPTVLLALWVVACGPPAASPAPAAPPDHPPSQALFREGDRVAWVGSSSTRIGVWPRTVEFLLRTRHPGLGLRFRRFTTGGGTFATGLEHLDEWLGDYRPSVVVFNYGGNDAGAGRQGLPGFKDNMEKCVARARAMGARVVLVTPQAADVRKAGAEAAARRALYAEVMLGYGRERGWAVVDVHSPLDLLQRAGRRGDPGFTILRDTIHLTDPAYVAWGFYFYDRLGLPLVRSEAVLTAAGDVGATENCEVRDVEVGQGSLAFTRIDRVLPVLPPGPLPPRLAAPLEAHARYLLGVTGLEPGEYEVRCEGRPIGVADAEDLAVGVNLNSLLLDGGREAPWAGLAEALWEGRGDDRLGRARWRFEVRRR